MTFLNYNIPTGDWPPWWGYPYSPPAQPTFFSYPKIPHKCPICEGRGNVPFGFYGRSEVEGGPTELCRQCEGKGVIYT